MVFSTEKNKLRYAEGTLQTFVDDLKTVVIADKPAIIREMQMAIYHLNKAREIFKQSTDKA